MDIFDQGIIEFWAAMSEAEVEYIMVGGFAVNAHRFKRAT
jgi:hypothetical protein